MAAEIKDTIATAAIGNFSLQRPRPKTYVAGAKTTKAYFVKNGFKISKMGKFLRDVLKEAEMGEEIAAGAISATSTPGPATDAEDYCSRAASSQLNTSQPPMKSSGF
eukprot:5526061-Pyramimonas_sp.AAC.1